MCERAKRQLLKQDFLFSFSFLLAFLALLENNFLRTPRPIITFKTINVNSTLCIPLVFGKLKANNEVME